MPREFAPGKLKRLSDADLSVADGEPDVRGWDVVSADGRDVGEVEDLIVDTDAMKVRYLEVDIDGQHQADDVFVPIASADLDRDRKRVIVRGSLSSLPEFSSRATRHTDADRADVDRSASGERRLTRAEEQVEIGKRPVTAGEVRVGKHVETEHRRENVTVSREEVHVERRPVSDGRTADIRASDQEIRVPVVEEQVIVEKHPVVKEELIVSKETVQENRPVDVDVRKERFDIKDESQKKRAREDTNG